MIADTTPDGPDDTVARGPGRPRDVHVDQVIVDAACDVLGDAGPSGFTIDAVATRAGVGKATIYRRWPSKVELLLAVAREAVFELGDPDTGSLRTDLVVFLTQMGDKFRNTMAGRVLPAVLAEAAGNPEMHHLVAQFIAERRQLARGILVRGVERGELPDGVDLDWLLDLVSGPVFVRVLLTQMPVDETVMERTVETVLRGLTETRGT
jgi:AcrR family transcriptional regulator